MNPPRCLISLFLMANAMPVLRRYMNLMALDGLPEFSAGPRPPLASQLCAIKDAGFDGVQFADPAAPSDIAQCRRLGLGLAGSGRISEPHDADPLAARFASEGMEAATVHVGWGIEDDCQAARLIEATLSASAKHKLPLLIETHRATIFQDMWRTVQFIRKFPEVRVNADFSHWYTGQEMVYGGFDRKLAFIAPVLDRVRFVHGRIGNPGSIQVDIGDGRDLPFVEHFSQMWTAAFRGFLRTAEPGESVWFAPELLAPRIFYARTFPDTSGRAREESDRWQQSLILVRISERCFAQAAQLAAAGS